MKNSLLLFGLASLFSPAVSSAAILVGFHAFEHTANTEDADVATSGFSATFNKNTESHSTGGSNDNTYGNSLVTVRPSATNDGVYRMYGGTRVISTTLSGSAVGSYQLNSFLLDAGTTTAHVSIGNIGISYSLNGGSSIPLTSTPFDLDSVGDGFNAFSGYGFAFPNVILNPGDTLTISLTLTDGSARLDNLAITGELVPEPSAVILASVGMLPLLRRRRSS